MATEITLPTLGMDMQEATIVRWLAKEGEEVRKGDPVLEIDTDKTSFEVEAPESGTLANLTGKEGETLPVGTLLAYVLAPGEEVPQEEEEEGRRPLVPDATPESPPEEPLSPEPGAPVPEEVSPGEVPAAGGPSEPTPSRSVVSGRGSGGRLRASPAARRLASERGVELLEVRGSGPGGRVYLSDVAGFEAAPEPASPVAEEAPAEAPSEVTPVAEGAGVRREALTQVRRIGAERTQKSFSEVPHFYLRREMDAGGLLALRSRLKERLEAAPSLNDLVAFAVSRTLPDHPRLNARFDEGTQELLIHEGVNLGIAAATEKGLLVPVVKGAERLRLRELASTTRELLDKAREGKLAREELTGGTFTISNLGMMGVDSFDAIINQPEAAILAVGRVRTVPEYSGEEWVPRKVFSCTLSVDHRVADGADGARFLADLAGALTDWELLL